MAIDQSEFNAAMAVYLAANDHTIALRRGLEASLPSGLLQGELYYATNTKTLRVGHGDGTSVSVGLSAYPVGSIYITTGSTSPATLFGGTWAAFGTGRVLVGIDAGQTEFDTVEETGGEKTHTLTEGETPAHAHLQNLTSGASGASVVPVYSASKLIDYTTYTQNTGGGGAHNNLQPYIVVRMWKRTA